MPLELVGRLHRHCIASRQSQVSALHEPMHDQAACYAGVRSALDALPSLQVLHLARCKWLTGSLELTQARLAVPVPVPTVSCTSIWQSQAV